MISAISHRWWRSFVGGRRAHRHRTAGRGRDGYSLWQRFWASFTGVDLPYAEVEQAGKDLLTVNLALQSAAALSCSSSGRTGTVPREASHDRSRTSPLAPGWFPLPQLPPVGGLAAAGGDTVLLEASSPDGTARFLVRSHGDSVPAYSLELVVRGIEGTAPLMTAVGYTGPDGPERVLLVPVVQGRFGPAASYVRLPGFVGGGWTASVPVAVGPDSAWDVTTVVLSVGASLNDATRDAWRRVGARIADAGLRHVIDEELR